MSNNAQFTIKLGVNSSGVTAGINSAVNQVTRLVQSFGNARNLTIAAASGIAKFLQMQAAWAGGINDSADTLDTTARNVQALKFAAAATKTEYSEFEGAILKVAKAQSEALQGGESQIRDFQRLGYSLGDIKRLGAEEIFIQVTKAMAEGKISGANYASMLAIVGKESARLKAAMKDGAGVLADEFRNSSFVVQQNLVNALDEADQSLSKLWAKTKAVGRWFAANLAGGALGVGKLAVGSVAGLLGATGLRDQMAVSRELQNDSEYGKSLEISAKMEARLNAKLALENEEHQQYEILKKKNDERQREVELAGMSVDQRNRALETEKAELQAAMAKTNTELEREKIRGRIIDLSGKISKPEGGQVVRGLNINPLQQIGARVSGDLSAGLIVRDNTTAIRNLTTKVETLTQKLPPGSFLPNTNQSSPRY